MTLPSQGRVHRSPEPPGALFLGFYKILTSHKLQQIGGGGLPPICYNCEIKIYKYLDRGSLQVARKRGTALPGSLEGLDLMNIVERERRAPGGSGDR